MWEFYKMHSVIQSKSIHCSSFSHMYTIIKFLYNRSTHTKTKHRLMIPDRVYVRDQNATIEVLRELRQTRLGKSLSPNKIHASFPLNPS